MISAQKWLWFGARTLGNGRLMSRCPHFTLNSTNDRQGCFVRPLPLSGWGFIYLLASLRVKQGSYSVAKTDLKGAVKTESNRSDCVHRRLGLQEWATASPRLLCLIKLSPSPYLRSLASPNHQWFTLPSTYRTHPPICSLVPVPTMPISASAELLIMALQSFS